MASKNKLVPSQDDQPGPQADTSVINRLLGALGQTWPARLAQDAWSGVTAPGDAYTGRLQVIDPHTGHVTDDAIARAASLAGVAMTGGVGGVPGEGAALGSGPIRAYHGSPHDFDAFDLAKIGTGEGAQAYGHGLYFADKEAVAQSYRDTLRTPTINGRPITVDSPPEHIAAGLIAEQGSAQAALASIQRDLANVHPDDAHLVVPLKAAAAAISSGRRLPVAAPGGKMYEVGINADPHAFLNYDAALPPNHPVRSLLGDAARAAYDQAEYGAGRNAAKDALLAARSENLTGAGAYNSLVRSVADAPAFVPGGEGYFKPAAASASSLLNEAGVPGIKYLDQGSRGVGDGSRNYVVFNPAIVDIMRKYGVASMAALPPAVLAAIQQGQSDPGQDQPQQPVNRLLGPSA